MAIRFPSPRNAAECGRLVETLAARNYDILQSEFVPPIYESDVEYREDEPGRDQWDDCLTCYRRGFGDCEELAAWRLAELWKEGYEAFGTARRTGPNLLHALVEHPDGAQEDPSKVLHEDAFHQIVLAAYPGEENAWEVEYVDGNDDFIRVAGASEVGFLPALLPPLARAIPTAASILGEMGDSVEEEDLEEIEFDDPILDAVRVYLLRRKRMKRKDRIRRRRQRRRYPQTETGFLYVPGKKLELETGGGISATGFLGGVLSRIGIKGDKAPQWLFSPSYRPPSESKSSLGEVFRTLYHNGLTA